MRIITIVVPTYNEEKNIPSVYERVCELFQNVLKDYKMQLLFIDNASLDSSRILIEQLCKKDRRVPGAFNAQNRFAGGSVG